MLEIGIWFVTPASTYVLAVKTDGVLIMRMKSKLRSVSDPGNVYTVTMSSSSVVNRIGFARGMYVLYELQRRMSSEGPVKRVVVLAHTTSLKCRPCSTDRRVLRDRKSTRMAEWIVVHWFTPQSVRAQLTISHHVFVETSD